MIYVPRKVKSISAYWMTPGWQKWSVGGWFALALFHPLEDVLHPHEVAAENHPRDGKNDPSEDYKRELKSSSSPKSSSRLFSVILERKVDVDHKDVTGPMTAFQYAVRAGRGEEYYERIIQLLLDHGAIDTRGLEKDMDVYGMYTRLLHHSAACGVKALQSWSFGVDNPPEDTWHLDFEVACSIVCLRAFYRLRWIWVALAMRMRMDI